MGRRQTGGRWWVSTSALQLPGKLPGISDHARLSVALYARLRHLPNQQKPLLQVLVGASGATGRERRRSVTTDQSPMSGEDGSFDHACRSGGRQRPEGLEGYGVENRKRVRPHWGWVAPAYTRSPNSRVMRPNCPVLNLPPYRGGRSHRLQTPRPTACLNTGQRPGRLR